MHRKIGGEKERRLDSARTYHAELHIATCAGHRISILFGSVICRRLNDEHVVPTET